MNSTYINPVIAGLNVRSVLIDVFKEAQHASEVPTGYNPALATKQPCQTLTISLRDVSAGCRDLYDSKYLVHYTRITSQSQPGGQVTANTLTTNFKKARDKTDIDWRDGTPATRN